MGADRNGESKLGALRDAVRVAVPAYWASWADCTPMIFNRHPDVANPFVHELEGAREGVWGAAEARRAMIGVLGFDPWPKEPAHHGQEPEDMELWSGHGGVVHSHGAERQSAGEVASWSRGRHHPLCCKGPSHPHSSPFVPLLLRRLRFPLPLSLHNCRCGRQIDKFGQARAGVLGRRGFALESATARVCREAGGRVSTNVMVCDLDLDDPRAADAHRLEVVQEQRTWMGWFWTEFAAGRSEHDKNWWALEDGPALLFLGSRLEPHPS